MAGMLGTERFATKFRHCALSIPIISAQTQARLESYFRKLAAERMRDMAWASAIAQVYAFRGERDKALEWLNRAYAQHDEQLCITKGDPMLQALNSDPRYKAFLRKMNLPE